jgi:UDP-2,4-diacetamido-2,4,6-trideoxy-beta-L-altropyranose hydrolase
MSLPMIGIRTQAGEGIGLGHVRRCLALAHALSGVGAEVRIVVDEDDRTVELIRAQGFHTVGVASGDALAQTCATFREWQVRAVIADSYELDTQSLAVLRDVAGFLVVIDDLADREIPADIVTNSAIHASTLPYAGLPGTLYLLGPRFALLSREFTDTPRPKIRGQVEQVLITIGGSDPSGLSDKLAEWTLDCFGTASINVVVGPFFPSANMRAPAAIRERSRLEIHHAPREMHALMLKADLAVTGGGQTTYELAATGTPAAAICIAENQRGNLRGLAEAGTLEFVGDASDGDLEFKIVSALTDLAVESERRQRMSERGRQLVDGRGAERVAQEIVRRCGVI